MFVLILADTNVIIDTMFQLSTLWSSSGIHWLADMGYLLIIVAFCSCDICYCLFLLNWSKHQLMTTRWQYHMHYQLYSLCHVTKNISGMFFVTFYIQCQMFFDIWLWWSFCTVFHNLVFHFILWKVIKNMSIKTPVSTKLRTIVWNSTRI